jgi:hypothetical protein
MLERFVAASLACSLLAACNPGQSSTPPRADWVISSHIEVDRGRLHSDEFRLIIPSVIGALEGQPTSASYLAPSVNSELEFELDLNPQHAALLDELKAYEPQEGDPFAQKPWYLEPRDTRIASFFPAIINARFNQLGNARWLNADTGNRLLLVYFDRPARLHGEFFDVRATEAGYVWIEVPQRPAVAQAVPRPASLALAFFPDASRGR